MREAKDRTYQRRMSKRGDRDSELQIEPGDSVEEMMREAASAFSSSLLRMWELGVS